MGPGTYRELLCFDFGAVAGRAQKGKVLLYQPSERLPSHLQCICSLRGLLAVGAVHTQDFILIAQHGQSYVTLRSLYHSNEACHICDVCRQAAECASSQIERLSLRIMKEVHCSFMPPKSICALHVACRCLVAGILLTQGT